MKIELKPEALNIVVGLLKQADPQGFFTGGLADNIIEQYNRIKREEATPPEDRELIKKIEEGIKNEPNQPEGGAWGEMKEYKERNEKK